MSENVLIIINEAIKISLNENVKQAEKILNANGIPLNDPTYVDIKQKLLNSNSIGYLGWIIKLATNNGSVLSQGRVDAIYDLLIQYKDILNKLPKPIIQYTDFMTLRQDLSNLSRSQLIKRFTTKFTNPIIKNGLLNSVLMSNPSLIDYIKYFNKIDSGDQKEFLSKSDKYKNFEDFVSDFTGFLDDHKSGFKYDNVLSKISELDKNSIKILIADASKQYIFVRILDYKASKAIGSEAWCIVGSEGHFNNYTADGKNYQYFFFNFNPSVEANEKMLAFTLDDDNYLTASHDRYDEEFPDIKSYLTDIGIISKIYSINSRERTKNKLNQRSTAVKYLDHNGNESQNDLFIGMHKYTLKPVMTFLNMLTSKVDTNQKNNLDIVFEKFQNYKIPVSLGYNSKIDHYDYQNILVDAFDNYDNINKYLERINEMYHNYDYENNSNITYKIPSVHELITIANKVYKSNIKLSQNSKVSILHFLKDHGEDVLDLSKQAKSKKGEDLSDMEFAMLKNKGENLKPIIQNKLAAIRRGEDVTMNTAEINYAIDNGLKKIIYTYYKNSLPDYSENQLDYEDMQIYKKLGLFDELLNVIYRKGKMYGEDSLNSIEKSIYDYAAK